MRTAITARMDASSNRMPEIMRVIDAIAFQTNIIALQAAVREAEANHAGSSGQAQGIEPDGNAGR
jgi:methyl-accepting chemotaxis protein